MNRTDWTPAALSAFWNRVNFPLKHDAIWWGHKFSDRIPKPLPDWEKQYFFRFLRERNLFRSGDHVLDVGCGLGSYSLVLAQHGGIPVGVDFSAQLIEGAQKAEQEQRQLHPTAHPVHFSVCDWDSADPVALQFKKRFDLVFAHCSPAADQASAIDKMIQCSRRACCIAKPHRTEDALLDAAKAALGISLVSDTKDLQLPLTLSYLLQVGLRPTLDWAEQTWTLADTPDQLRKDLQSRLEWGNEPLTSQQLLDLDTFIHSLEHQEGRIRYSIGVSISLVSWFVPEAQNHED